MWRSSPPVRLGIGVKALEKRSGKLHKNGRRHGRRTLPPILSAAAFCTGGVCGAWLLGDVQPLALLCELIVASGLYMLLPATPTARLPAPDMAAAPAAAFQAVYDSLPAEAPALRPENPAVLFDRAAEQVCRDCPLRTDCWQTHYTDTYNAYIIPLQCHSISPVTL